MSSVDGVRRLHVIRNVPVLLRRWPGVSAFLLGALLLTAASCADSGDPTPGLPNPGVVLCVGDSITAGYGLAAGYPEYLAALIGEPVVNAGQSYEKSADGVAKTPGLLDEHRPSRMTILYGINDVQESASETIVVDNIRTMVRTATARRVKPVVGLVMPVRDILAGFNPAVERLNAALLAMARAEGVPTVDLYSLFVGRDDLYLDAIHPNEAGSRAIAAAFAAHIDP
jgi:lysophospholipase L1-like esterase